MPVTVFHPERVKLTKKRAAETLPGGTGPWNMKPSELARHIGCKSEINVARFTELSIGYDPEALAGVISGLNDGWRLGVTIPPPSRPWAQSFMSDEGRARITAHFDKETDEKRMLGPFTTPPSGEWSRSVAFPVAEVDKPDGSHRTTYNMSYDWERSVNAGIPPEAGRTKYPTFEEVAQAILEIGLDDVYFALYDIQNAFRNIRVHPDDWIYLVVAWQITRDGPRQWRIDLALPFGVTVGPKIFNDFGDCLEYILRLTCLTTIEREIIARLLRYLDDHLLVIRGLEAAEEVLDRLLAMMKELNIPVKDAKTIRPTPEIKYVGFWWDPRRDLVTLSRGRWADLEAELTRIELNLDMGGISAGEIRSLAGLLCWASKIVNHGMIYTRELYSVVADLGMSSATKAQAKHTLITSQAMMSRIRLDTSWWHDLCTDYRTLEGGSYGRRISRIGMPPDYSEPLTLELYSDMSGGGLGGYWSGTSHWCWAPMANDLTLDKKDHTRTHISSGHGEASGILLCLLTFLPLWAARYPDRRPGARVVLHSDSTVAVSVWNSQRGREKLRPYLRRLERLCAFYNIEFELKHIAGVDNVIADLISRLKDGVMTPQLRSAFPEADDRPQPKISPDLFFL